MTQTSPTPIQNTEKLLQILGEIDAAEVLHDPVTKAAPPTVDQTTGEVIQPAATSPLEAMLADYENMQAMLDVIRMNMAEAKAAVIPQEVQNDLEAIEAEFSAKLEQGQAKLDDMKAQIAAGVKAFGKTVNGSVYQAQYVKPSWGIRDVPGLLAYAASGHPEIMRFPEESKPSARVVVRRGGK
jgi:hypothetical protein